MADESPEKFASLSKREQSAIIRQKVKLPEAEWVAWAGPRGLLPDVEPEATPAALAPVLSPQAQKEKAFIYQQHYQPTPQELEAMSPEEYRRWRSLEPEGPMRAEPGPVIAERRGEKPHEEPDIPTLEAMSDEDYHAWYLSREDQSQKGPQES